MSGVKKPVAKKVPAKKAAKTKVSGVEASGEIVSKPKKSTLEKVRKDRAERKNNERVYFACKAGTYVVQSKDVQPVSVDGKMSNVPIPEVKLEFFNGVGHTGVSRPLHPEYDAELIAAFREHIREAEENGYYEDFARVRTNNLREIDPNTPPIPVGEWDDIDPAKIRTIVETLGKDPDECLRYEEYSLNRPEVVETLELMIAEAYEAELADAKPDAEGAPAL